MSVNNDRFSDTTVELRELANQNEYVQKHVQELKEAGYEIEKDSKTQLTFKAEVVNRFTYSKYGDCTMGKIPRLCGYWILAVLGTLAFGFLHWPCVKSIKATLLGKIEATAKSTEKYFGLDVIARGVMALVLCIPPLCLVYLAPGIRKNLMQYAFGKVEEKVYFIDSRANAEERMAFKKQYGFDPSEPKAIARYMRQLVNGRVSNQGPRANTLDDDGTIYVKLDGVKVEYTKKEATDMVKERHNLKAEDVLTDEHNKEITELVANGIKLKNRFLVLPQGDDSKADSILLFREKTDLPLIIPNNSFKAFVRLCA